MNVFAVDNNPSQAARDLPDKLVVKMPTESLQLLTPWVYNTFGIRIRKKEIAEQLNLFPLESGEKKFSDKREFYGIKGFAHHPCSKWLYESNSNVYWLLEHAISMLDEYSVRYGNKTHGALYGLSLVQGVIATEIPNCSASNHTEFVQAMPEESKIPGDPVQAYRDYLMDYKGYAEWRHGDKPKWWDEERHSLIRKQYLDQRHANLISRQNDKHKKVQRAL